MSVRPPVLRRKLCTAIAAAFLSITVAHAGELSLDMPPQDMGAALTQLARQANVQILYATTLVDGKRAPALKGGYTPETALRALLAGSGLEFRASGDGTFALRPAPPARKSEAPADQQLAAMVVSATRTGNPLGKVAASLSVATLDDFDEVQAATVSQVMKKLPNVDFGGGPRVNGEVPTVRGVFGPSLTLLVDGARQNDTTSPGMKSPLYLDPYFLKQAEVLRGSASSLYGSGGNGGVMAFTTLSARDLLAPGQTIGGGARAGYATADKSESVNARIYAADESADALLAMGKRGWNKIRQGGGDYLDPNDGNAATGLVKLGLQPGKEARIEFSHQFYRSQNLQVNNPQATVYRATNLPLDKPAVQLTHIGQDNTVLKGLFGDTGGAPAIIATLYRSQLDIIADKNPDPTITNVLYSTSRTVTDGASVQGTLLLGAPTAMQHRVTAGIDTFKDRQSAVAATAANPAATSSVIRNGSRKAMGIFGQDEITLAEGWRLTPSVRADHYDAGLGDNSLAPNSASRVSPKLALAWDGQGLMLYGSYGESFRAPTVNELYQNYSGFGLTNFLPNASLKPEIDRTAEIGANYRRKGVLAAADNLQLRAALFNSRATDLIYNANLGGMTPTGSTAPQQAGFAANCAATGLNCKFQYQNIASAKRSGGELEAGYGIDLWQLNAAYSRVRITDNAGNGLFSPPDKFSLQVRRQLPREGVAAYWNTTAIAAQDYDATVLRRRSGHATHDLFLSWSPAGQKFKIDAGVGNLFDKRYSTYQSSNAYAYTYQEGRSLKVSLGADF